MTKIIEISENQILKVKMPLIKAVILIGGPQKGTRFRPLSLDHPKPLFPVTNI